VIRVAVRNRIVVPCRVSYSSPRQAAGSRTTPRGSGMNFSPGTGFVLHQAKRARSKSITARKG